MAVGSVTSSINTTTGTTTTNTGTDTTKAAETKSTETKSNEAAAVYMKADSSPGAKSYKVDISTIDRLKKDSEDRISSFRNMVEKLISKQGLKFEDVLKNNDPNFKIEVDAETQKKAQEEVSEDGYWGVKQTSGRILDFAKALAGDNPELIKKMKAAVESGFSAAKKDWGKDEMPPITKQTYDAVMKGFDDWEKGVAGSTAAAATGASATTTSKA